MDDLLSKLYAVVNLSYDLSNESYEWEEKIFFIGSQRECLDWVFTNCSSDSSSGFLEFWYGSKRVEVHSLVDGKDDT